MANIQVLLNDMKGKEAFKSVLGESKKETESDLLEKTGIRGLLEGHYLSKIMILVLLY